jgi:hypothetical protein
MLKAIANGASANQADDRGYTPLHVLLMTTINPFWWGVPGRGRAGLGSVGLPAGAVGERAAARSSSWRQAEPGGTRLASLAQGSPSSCTHPTLDTSPTPPRPPPLSSCHPRHRYSDDTATAMKILLDAKANPNTPLPKHFTQTGITPLHWV